MSCFISMNIKKHNLTFSHPWNKARASWGSLAARILLCSKNKRLAEQKKTMLPFSWITPLPCVLICPVFNHFLVFCRLWHCPVCLQSCYNARTAARNSERKLPVKDKRMIIKGINGTLDSFHVNKAVFLNSPGIYNSSAGQR